MTSLMETSYVFWILVYAVEKAFLRCKFERHVHGYTVIPESISRRYGLIDLVQQETV